MDLYDYAETGGLASINIRKDIDRVLSVQVL